MPNPDDKLDLFKTHKAEYAQPKKAPVIVDTSRAQYLAVDGHGQPGDDLFQSRLSGLYGMAYTLKFTSKFAGRDYSVCKLEGLYGVQGQTLDNLQSLAMKDWRWTLMIRTPDFVTDRDLDAARSTLREKGKEGDFDDVRLDVIEEGTCIQMLHVGPYEDEERTLEIMRTFARDEGLVLHRWHHEIYLSDPRRIPPERLKTILRLPARPEASAG